MAKVQGALFSVDASGTYAGKLTFAKWKGRQYVRNRVDPSNPMTADQTSSRNRVRVAGAAQHFANLSADLRGSNTLTDKALLAAAAPSGQAWNGYLVKSMVGTNGANYIAGQAAFAALSSGEKSAWDSAAAGLTPAIPAVAQKAAGNTASTALTAGNVFFLYVYGLYIAGLSPVPGATPPTYA